MGQPTDAGRSAGRLRNRVVTRLRLLARAPRTEWVVDAKAPFTGPQQVLDYFGRYTYRVAISNSRVLDLENGHVRFRYKDSAVSTKKKSPVKVGVARPATKRKRA